MFVRQVNVPALGPTPRDPLGPRDVLLLPRRRPATVTVAAVLLLGGAVTGALHAVVLLAGAGPVLDAYLRLATTTAASPDQITATGHAIGSAYAGIGTATALLALGRAVAGVALLRWRGPIIRYAALGVVAATVGIGLAGTGITALGGSLNWGAHAGLDDPLRGALGAAYATAVPEWLVGLTGGLTCLESIAGVIAAATLLTADSARYHRRRVTH